MDICNMMQVISISNIMLIEVGKGRGKYWLSVFIYSNLIIIA